MSGEKESMATVNAVDRLSPPSFALLSLWISPASDDLVHVFSTPVSVTLHVLPIWPQDDALDNPAVVMSPSCASQRDFFCRYGRFLLVEAPCGQHLSDWASRSLFCFVCFTWKPLTLCNSP